MTGESSCGRAEAESFARAGDSSVHSESSVNIGARVSRSLYQVTLQGTGSADLYDAVTKFEKSMRQLNTIQDVNTDVQVNTPQISVDIDLKQASALGVPLRPG